MTNIDKLHEIVKTSLNQFVNSHITAADLSVVDEIVLNYIISILEEAAEDPHFDVEGFVEMMSAYFPDFSQIGTATICEWIFKLESQISNEKKTDESPQLMSKKSLRLSDIIPESKLLSKTSGTLESSDITKFNVDIDDVGSPDLTTCDFFTEECDSLHEIFPESSFLEIKHCITIANGDIDRATQIILDRQEKGQSIVGSFTNGPKMQAIDDNELKNRIISRYSYVDSNTEPKEYKPVVPKLEPKKLVRYRDNKIVSLKGERYTEVRGDGTEAELRKSKKPISP